MPPLSSRDEKPDRRSRRRHADPPSSDRPPSSRGGSRGRRPRGRSRSTLRRRTMPGVSSWGGLRREWQCPARASVVAASAGVRQERGLLRGRGTSGRIPARNTQSVSTRRGRIAASAAHSHSRSSSRTWHNCRRHYRRALVGRSLFYPRNSSSADAFAYAAAARHRFCRRRQSAAAAAFAGNDAGGRWHRYSSPRHRILSLLCLKHHHSSVCIHLSRTNDSLICCVVCLLLPRIDGFLAFEFPRVSRGKCTYATIR